MKLATLCEGTLNFEKDVENIFNVFFRPIIIKLAKKEITETEFAWEINTEVELSSEEMIERGVIQSQLLINTAKVIPVTFKFHTPNLSAIGRYDTNTKTLFFTFAQENVLSLLDEINFDFNFQGDLPDHTRNELERFYRGESVKEMINHELTHWVDDARSGGALSSQIARARVPKGQEPTKSNIKAYNLVSGGHDNKNLGPAEINAIVNGIAEIRNKTLKSAWDNITFDQLIDNSQALSAVKHHLEHEYPHEYQKWRNLIIKRMARENLLGRNMRSEIR